MNINDFTLTQLTAAINQFPVQWGRIGQMGLFRDIGLRNRSLVIEDRAGTLALLPTHAWGGDGTVASGIVRKTYPFSILQTTHDDIVLPADAQDVRAFGSETGESALSQEVALRLQRMRARHDATLEWKRMGALKGNVLNADGTSSLANLFSTFGLTQVSVDFVLGTATTDILGKCAALKNQIEDNLKGDTMTGVRVLVSPEWFQKFIQHPKVQDAYKYHSEAAVRLGTDQRRGFVFGDVVFEEYRAQFNGARLIAANEGHAFPEGTMDTFATYYAPADFNETVNTIAQPMYVKTWPKDGDRGTVLHTQCNSLPLCHQPAVLVKVISSN
jgi:Phage major capsid protein E